MLDTQKSSGRPGSHRIIGYRNKKLVPHTQPVRNRDKDQKETTKNY